MGSIHWSCTFIGFILTKYPVVGCVGNGFMLWIVMEGLIMPSILISAIQLLQYIHRCTGFCGVFLPSVSLKYEYIIVA